jgi:hypothetical protein
VWRRRRSGESLTTTARELDLTPEAAAVSERHAIDLDSVVAQLEEGLRAGFVSQVADRSWLDIPEGTHAVKFPDEWVVSNCRQGVVFAAQPDDEALWRAYWLARPATTTDSDPDRLAGSEEQYQRELQRVSADNGYEPLVEALHQWFRRMYCDPSAPDGFALRLIVEEADVRIPVLDWSDRRHRGVEGVWWWERETARADEATLSHGTLWLRADGLLYDSEGNVRTPLTEAELHQLPNDLKAITTDTVERLNRAERDEAMRGDADAALAELFEHFRPGGAEEMERTLYVERMTKLRDSLPDEERRVFDQSNYVEEIHGEYEDWLDNYSAYIKRQIVDTDGRDWVEWRAPEWSEDDADRNWDEVRRLHASLEATGEIRRQSPDAAADGVTYVTIETDHGYHVVGDDGGLVGVHTTMLEGEREAVVKMMRLEKGRTLNPSG